jgi:hypothetical protein
MDIGAHMRLEVVGDVSSRSASPVVTVKGCYRGAARKA